MKKFKYYQYEMVGKALDDYYAIVGYNHQKVWDIHDELTCIYNNMCANKVSNEESAIKTIEKFVKHCKVIKEVYHYPISMQETLQRLILIAYYPSLEYENIKTAAYNAVHIFHTTINHPGE